jgi:small conductance mechanosensitive channel
LTTSNPSISKDELVLLLVPLSKEELLIEAGGWQEIVKAKAQEIARAEIAVLRDNKAIDKAEALRKKTEATKAQVEKVAEKVAAIDEAEEAKKAEKVDLLENVTTLREERTLMLDNMRIVINELEAKTDKDDADTRARIKDYRRYISTVSGIHVDVSDTTSAWVSLKGWVTSEQGGLRWLVNIGSFLGILVLSWFLAKFLSKMMHKAMARVALSALLVDFLVKSVHWVVMFIGIIWALSALEISIAPLLALVGAAGFIIAFAMQDSLSNFASGLMILFFRPFDMDDLVDAGGVSGKVSSMNLVSTTIRTLDNKLMVVPNSKIWNDVITNATGVTERRVDLEFGIGYSDDIEQAHQILEEIVASHPKVLKDPAPLIKLSALADSSVNFICRPWTETIDYWDVYWDITKEVKKRFDAAGIGIPFPQRDVHLYIEKGMEIDRLAAQDRNSK